MSVHAAPPRSQRLTVLATVTGVHCLAFLAIFASKTEVLPLPAKPGALSMVSLNADSPAQTPPPPPTLPSKMIDRTEPPREMALSDQPDSTATGAPLAGCATLEVVTNALVDDRAAVDAIHRAPLEARSISGAVVMWNAGWSDTALTFDAPLGLVRAVAEQSLHSVDAGCLEEEIAGPRLVPIPIGDETMFVVFGSGIWRWRELIFSTDAVQHAAFYRHPAPSPLWPF